MTSATAPSQTPQRMVSSASMSMRCGGGGSGGGGLGAGGMACQGEACAACQAASPARSAAGSGDGTGGGTAVGSAALAGLAVAAEAGGAVAAIHGVAVGATDGVAVGATDGVAVGAIHGGAVGATDGGAVAAIAGVGFCANSRRNLAISLRALRAWTKPMMPSTQPANPISQTSPQSIMPPARGEHASCPWRGIVAPASGALSCGAASMPALPRQEDEGEPGRLGGGRPADHGIQPGLAADTDRMTAGRVRGSLRRDTLEQLHPDRNTSFSSSPRKRGARRLGSPLPRG